MTFLLPRRSGEVRRHLYFHYNHYTAHRQLIRIMKKFAVIGHPIGHTKSPVLHEAGFIELEIDATFEAVEVAPGDLASWVNGEFRNYHGVAVTIPHKEALLPLVQKLSPAAEAIGAVNTLYWEEDVICGTNTDCLGALRAIQSELPVLEGKKVLVLGAGGAARAVVFALKTAGAVTAIWNRTTDKAIKLAADFEIDPVESLSSLNPDNFDVIINATSVGLREWKSVLPADFWSPHHVAFDMVYDPLETKFLSDAAEAEAPCVTGDKMLVGQALEQFKLWHGVELEPEVMGTAFFQ